MQTLDEFPLQNIAGLVPRRFGPNLLVDMDNPGGPNLLVNTDPRWRIWTPFQKLNICNVNTII
jgi:hypothetical protein